MVATIQDVSERVRTDSMRTDFVTNISHELKTPVGAIAVLAEALMDETEPEVVHRLADLLVEESHRAVRTIDDLLKLSQIESVRPGDTPVSLTSVVQSAIARGRVVDDGRGVEISTFDAPDDRVDPRRRAPAPVGGRQPRRERGEVQPCRVTSCRCAPGSTTPRSR